MLKQALFTSSLIFLCLLHCSILVLAQSPALAPAPSGPTNVTKILEKAGAFSVLIRLLKSTQMISQLNSQLNDSNNEMTIFAPSDSGFSSLKTGTLNSLTDQQQVELLQFHMIPNYLTMSQFQTVSNPLRTEAGGDNSGRFAFNITTTGNSVNITTGLTNTSVSGTVYTDGQLAIYQVDKVLLPIDVFTPKPPPAPAPAPAKPKKKHISESPSTAADASGAVSNYILITFNAVVVYGVAVVAAMFVTL
ncbi:fasciclin and related adhesion glycoprotein [Tripterygium wilfordii]|uniref:Fasciclin and related adhesion glycoprotein n=1 Tax=Tripterygium wilfordii TaxID=458696 RepID=A0A7J7DEE0_TRIWF|nr:fasciclin-like arabinogalactan protein 12 [Tripterygium wilfordii]KAF5744693.1 fasciclin and related adhesion glycoprotein [Tripterygium wilfordii]